ncbi:ATP-binding protein [Dechloromonas sp. ZY10]|uniref:ATP-binding protein n=1 Tax=Dechloromonas aquae TaxID=2664436 RepID=UPI00352921B5
MNSSAKHFVRRWFWPLLILMVGLVATLVAYGHFARQAELESRQGLRREVALLTSGLVNRLHDHAQLLRSVRAFFAASEQVTPGEWAAYVNQLQVDSRFSGVHAYGFAAWRDGRLHPSFPSVASREHSLLALDALQDTREAALRDDEASLSRPLLTASGESPPQLVMLLPVYRKQSAIATTEARRLACIGYAYVIYRPEELLAAALPRRSSQLLPVLADGSEARLPPLFDGRADESTAVLLEARQLAFGGRDWRLSFYLQGVPAVSGPLPLLLAGILLSLLLAWVARSRLLEREGEAAQAADAAAQAEDWRRKRDLLATVLHFVPHPVFVKNAARQYVAVNAAFCTLTGRREDELLGQKGIGSAHLAPDLVARIREVDDRVFAGEGEFCDEYEVPFDAGTRRVVARKALAYDPDGAPVLVGTLTDVSELRRVERQRNDILAAATEVSIIATDRNGLITLFNAGAEKMLGYAAEELLGRETPAIFHLESEIQARGETLSAELGRSVAGFSVFVAIPLRDGAERRDWTYVHKDGRQLQVSLVVTAVHNEAGALTGYLGVAVDVSARNAYARELQRHRDHLQQLVEERTADLRRAKETAEQASEAKSDFLANMSHELRTPMHAVLGFARLGEERAGDFGQDKLQHYFQRIHQSGQRLLDLLNNLLDLAKLEAGMMPIVPCEQALLPLLREVVHEFEALAALRGIRFELSGEERVAAVDAGTLAQVMRNLLSNALKFSPDHSVISIELTAGLLPRGRRAADPVDLPATCITVRDQGCGIPDNELEAVFDKFVQSSKTRTGAGGTGLGLSICRQIVLAHRGLIQASNHPAGGAALTITLPCAALPAGAAETLPKREGT